jgi:putative nucleotidyltransferase with HDIG domain
MAGHERPAVNKSADDLNLSPYAGRWVALVRGRIAGVGRTPDEARRAAQVARPKEKPEMRFVTVDDWQDHSLLRRLWAFIERQGADVLLVGGAVRDGLLGRPLHDLDFVVSGDAAALATAVSRAFRGALVQLDPKRKIFRVVMQHEGRRHYLDFAGRQGDSWSKDLRVRDFTVNAIGVDGAGRYVDPLGGREDLAAGRLRATSASAFLDDPLRMLRAVRLVAELGFTIAPETSQWIRRDAPLLSRAAAERIRDEFVRILDAAKAARHLKHLDNLSLLTRFIPEIEALRGLGQSPPHQSDVWTHTRLTVEATEALLAGLEGKRSRSGELKTPAWVWGDLEKHLGPFGADLKRHLAQRVSDTRDRRFHLKLAALLHDVGKPQSRTVGDDGLTHFYSHEKVGADLAAERMWALRFSGDEVALAQTIVAHHLRPGHLARSKGPTRRAVYRYFKATGDAGVEIGLLSLTDMLAVWGPTLRSPRWLRRLDVVVTLLSAFFEKHESIAPIPFLNGHELMGEFGLSPGPQVGRLLEAIREAQAAGEVKSRAEALALAAALRNKAYDVKDEDG